MRAPSDVWPHLVAIIAWALLGSACAGAASTPEPAASRPAPPRPAPPLATGLAPAAPAAEFSPASDAAEDASARGVLGYVAGQALRAEELLLEWNHFAPREIWLVVDKLVATRLAFAEAQRIGLRLDPNLVEARVSREQQLLEEGLQEGGATGSFEEQIRAMFAQTPAYYLARLREATIRQMIAERAVRAWTLGERNARLRLIVVPRGDLVGEIQAQLAAGADFAELAREHSVDDTASVGGLVPYFVYQSQSPLARLAFSTNEGTVGGPIAVGGHRIFALVEALRGPRDGGWSALREAVEASLVEDLVRDAEFLVWKLVMELRYPVDLTAAEKLLGAPDSPGR